MTRATPPMTITVSAPMTQAASRSVAAAASAVLGARGVVSVTGAANLGLVSARCPRGQPTGGERKGTVNGQPDTARWLNEGRVSLVLLTPGSVRRPSRRTISVTTTRNARFFPIAVPPRLGWRQGCAVLLILEEERVKVDVV